MPAIVGSEYRKIAVEYATARDKHLAMKQDFFDAVYIIVQLQSIVPEVDLLTQFWGAYQVNSDTINTSEMFLSSIRTLQSHVVSRGGFDNIDQYLVAEGITVPQTWADLSTGVGYAISKSNID